MQSPLISIIIPFYNASKFIFETLESVRTQTYTNWELILINDGSSDSSSEKVREYILGHPEMARVFSHPDDVNKGASASRNLGLMHATGELVCFLDADDIWMPDFLDFQVHLFDDHPEIAMAYGPFLFWESWDSSKRGQKDTVQKLGLPANRIVDGLTLIKLFLAKEDTVPSPTGVMLRRRVLAEVGGWEDSFRGMYDDLALYAKILLSGNTAYVAEKCLYRYRQHDNSLCRITRKEGTYWDSRKTYLDWLKQYILQKNLPSDYSNIVNQANVLVLFRKCRYYIRRAALRLIGFFEKR
jgi:glycosyltransferase involved in cell wall biosynthesis